MNMSRCGIHPLDQEIRINFGQRKASVLVAIAELQAKYKTVVPSSLLYRVLCGKDDLYCRDHVKRAVLSMAYSGFIHKINTGQYTIVGVTPAGAYLALSIIALTKGPVHASDIEKGLKELLTDDDYKALLVGSIPVSTYLERHPVPDCS